MRRGGRIAVGVLLAVGALVALGFLTRFDYTATPAESAALRLAWRARVPLVEECRRLTEAEQAELPVHMRREEVCEGRVASYRLEVVVDGIVRHAATVSGAGARGDRPLYVFETVPLEPGQRDVRVTMERIGEKEGGAPAEGGVPDRLALERELAVGSRELVLVTYDAAGRRLVVR